MPFVSWCLSGEDTIVARLIRSFSDFNVQNRPAPLQQLDQSGVGDDDVGRDSSIGPSSFLWRSQLYAAPTTLAKLQMAFLCSPSQLGLKNGGPTKSFLGLLPAGAPPTPTDPAAFSTFFFLRPFPSPLYLFSTSNKIQPNFCIVRFPSPESIFAQSFPLIFEGSY